MPNRPRASALALLLCCAGVASAADPILLAVDATDAPRRIFHAALSIPTRGWGPAATDPATGDLLLYYPRWIPGEHAPTGPVIDLAGVKFLSGATPLPWRRDPVDMHCFHVSVPKDAKFIEATLDYLSPSDPDGFSSAASATANLAIISWNTLLLYPRGMKSDDVQVIPSLKLPNDWKFGTSLESSKRAHADTITFPTVSLTTLVDSPVHCGRYLSRIELTPGQAPGHFLDIVADSAAALRLEGERLDAHKNLIAEALALFGARHYTNYTFLVSLSDNIAHFGLEHHESSDDRLFERSYIDDAKWRHYTGYLPHEFSHSWCGKHRRPIGLATGDFETPMKGEGLWVYEGLDNYLGEILTARSGFLDADEWRDGVAFHAADLDHRAGRQWRNLLDTADDAQHMYSTGDAWQSWRRTTDFYEEAELIWLEADALIREKTSNAKSLDDFCRLFLSASAINPDLATGKPDPSGRAPTTLPFTSDDVFAALNQVCPYDWKTFLTDRLTRTGEHAPLAGLTNSGWKLVYTDEPNPWENDRDSAEHETLDLRWGLGAKLSDDGAVVDAIPGSAAAAAGLAPAIRIVAVNTRKYTHDVMRDALAAAHDANDKSAGALELILDNGGIFTTVKLAYTGGVTHPHLARDESRPDVLSQIIAPRTRPAPKPAAEKKKG